MWYELLKHLKNSISENFNGNVYIGADIVTQVNYDEGDVIVLSRGFEERGERAEEKYPRMYVIKKDGIKRYIGEIQKISSGKLKSVFIKYMYNSITLGGELKIPKGITMLAVGFAKGNINEHTILYLKVVLNEIVSIYISGDNMGNAYSDIYNLYGVIVNGKDILSDASPLLGLPLMRNDHIICSYSEEINNYKGDGFITDIRNFPTISEESYNKNPELHFKLIDDK